MAREYSLDRYRNFGIWHIDAGKTTATERMFITQVGHTSWRSSRRQRDHGWMEQEQERGIAITLPQRLVFGSEQKMVRIHLVSMEMTQRRQNSVSILLIHPATWILPSRLSAHWLFLMALYASWTRMLVSSRKLRRCGDKLIVTKSRGLYL